MVFMSYVEVFATHHMGKSLSSFTTPLTAISAAYGVSFFKVPVALGAMVSFFSLSLSCLNAGARIIFPLCGHEFLPRKGARGARHEHDARTWPSPPTGP